MHLEQQKRQCRELLRAVRIGSDDALSRVRSQQGRWAHADDTAVRQEISLQDAQYVIAREQGFASWTTLKAYAERSSHPQYSRIFIADPHWIMERVNGLVRTRRSAGPAALEQIREWHPDFAGRSDDEILAAPFRQSDAQLVYARQHGFANWAEFSNRLLHVATKPDAAEPFLSAFRALQVRDADTLQSLLQRHRQLARDRGTNGNTLLNLAVSLSVPWQMIDMLLDAGADGNDANDRGWTPLHQAAYSNKCDTAERLIRSGADLDAEAHGSGGTPLVVALFWGHREVADLLASHSTAPGNLRTAAGLGNIDHCFTGACTLRPEATAARGFYRPHSGFPDWQPSPDKQEVLDEALVWACKSGRTEVLPKLLSAGAQIDADPYRGTPLIWAAVCNRIETAEWLIDNGAPINQKATFGGATHGQGITALHMAAQYGHLAMVQLLVNRGADPTIRDDLYHADAAGAANHFGHPTIRDYLRGLGR